MVEGVFPEVGLGLAGDPFAQEIAQDGTAGTHEHKGQHHHAAPRLRVAEQQKKAEDQQKQADSQEKGKDFFGFRPWGCFRNKDQGKGKKGNVAFTKSIACGHFFVKE